MENDKFISFHVSCTEIESSPVRCLVSEVKHTACGGDFTVWLSSVEGASILYVFKIKIAFCFCDCLFSGMDILFFLGMQLLVIFNFCL